MFQYICAFILLWLLVSAVWPDTRKQQAEAARKQQADADSKHAELLAKVAKLERQIAEPTVPMYHAPRSTYRDDMVALGRTHDLANGVKRHPVLDSPYVSVANPAPSQMPPARPAPISILTSDVVDGMPYTLYSDGSIEAQLPQGTFRFSSVDELRNHLELSA